MEVGIPLLSCHFKILSHYFADIFSASKDSMFSSILKYLTFGDSRVFRGNIGSLPNIRKNGLSLECSFGIKLYATQANVTTLSHSKFPDTCLDMQDLRK